MSTPIFDPETGEVLDGGGDSPPPAQAMSLDDARALLVRLTDSRERAGLYANTFNAPRDSLAGVLSQSFMTGINMNEALEDPNLGPPVVAHIASAIERLAREGRSKGFAIFIDEAAKLLRNPAFCDLAAEMYREYRKFGGAVGMAFQDPGALHKSGIADAVIENTASFFFFPNPQGNRSAYEPFNLNDEHKGFIFGAPEAPQPRQDRGTDEVKPPVPSPRWSEMGTEDRRSLTVDLRKLVQIP